MTAAGVFGTVSSAVARADNVYGDKNVFCSCVPIGDFKDEP